MLIQVVSKSAPEFKEKGRNKWQEITISYVSGGKKMDKKFLSFSPIFAAIKELEEGKSYDVTSEKDDSGYFQWTAIAAAKGSAEATPPVSRPSTYETPEERAKKQVYIVKQSSITSAIAYYAAIGAQPGVDEVLSLAQKFVDFVFDVDTDDADVDFFAGMKSDLPE